MLFYKEGSQKLPYSSCTYTPMIGMLSAWSHGAAGEAGKCILYSEWPGVQSKVSLALEEDTGY